VAFAVAAAVYLAGKWPVPPPRGAGPQGNGTLVVVAVFDQMRGDFPTRWAELYGGCGFERLKREGVFYRSAHLPYACSSTAPGHASIGTGVPPSVHGIVENKWYDRKRNAEMLAVGGNRPYTRVPASKEAAKSEAEAGFAPDQLLVEGIGDHLKRSLPGSKVFSLALKDRAAVLMGGKKPDGVYGFDTRSGEFHTTSYYADRPHRWVTEFNEERVADRWFAMKWERLGDAARYTVAAGPDDAPGETRHERDAKTGGLVGYGSTFPHALNIDGQRYPNVRYYDRVEASPFGNELVWELAMACIKDETLGTGGASDLLFLGFSANDVIGHKWGPDSHEVLDATVRTDRLIADMIAHLDAAVGDGAYTLIVTSDHGVCPLPEAARLEHPDAVRIDPRSETGPDGLGRALNAAFGAIDADGKGWFAHRDREYNPNVVLHRRAIEGHGPNPDAVAEYAAKWLSGRPHMQTAIPRSVLAGEASNDPLVRKAQLGFHPERSGDVYLIPKPYHLPAGGSGTTHGSPHPYDTWVPVLAVGPTVPKLGLQDDPISSLVVAPIVCHALGIAPPDTLTERLPKGWE
jgi:hypothetical protein